MEPRIETLAAKRLVGKKMSMSLSNNKTAALWTSFMPRRKLITNSLSSDLFSIQVYDNTLDFKNFDKETLFDKWAAIEVADFEFVPNEMEIFSLTGGLYAVFQYRGLSTDTSIFQYIFGTWLPNSNYVLDKRPHFELLGEKYKNDHPDSEEEIWIPIKPKE